MSSPIAPGSTLPTEDSFAQKTQQRSWFVKRFVLTFVPLALIAGLGIWGRELTEFSTAKTLIAGRETVNVEITRDALDDVLGGIHRDTMFLRDLESLKHFLLLSSEQQRQRVEADFLNLARNREVYDQIRYLDETGMEIVRVNFRQGVATPVATEKLQNKGKRYYFSDAFRLDRDETFVSPLDLNIERGKIEAPRKPMLRIGTPVYDQDNRKRGIVLINYYGQNLIDHTSELLRGAGGQPMLVNMDGFWLLAADPAREWGFMFKNDDTMAKTSPATWSRIRQSDKGQLWTDAGLYTFDTVYPMLPGQVSSTGSARAYDPSGEDLDNRGYFWKVMTKVDDDTLAAAWKEHFSHGSLLYGAALTLILAVCWFLARAHVTSRTDEEALRMMGFSVDHTADAVFWMNPDGKIRYVNQATCRLLGYSKEELLSRTADDIVASGARNETTPGWQELKTCRNLTYESAYRAKDGQTYPVEVSANRLNYGDNEYNCTFARDITARKQAEAERERMQGQLFDLSREAGKSEIATSVLHNVGNVLNSVTVSAGLAQEKLGQIRFAAVERIAGMLSEHASDLSTYLTENDKGRKVPEYLTALSEQLNAGRQLIEDELVSVARGIEHIREIVSRQQSYATVAGITESVSLADIVDDSIKMNVSARHEIDIVTEYEELPSVQVDKHRLIQIVVNLVRNAKQSVTESDGEKRIVVRLKQVGKHTARIEVEDTGVGIADENYAQIFDYGFTTKEEGRGFGLHNSANEAKNMGGSISCSSEGPGKGATFVLDLPLAPVDVVAVEKSA